MKRMIIAIIALIFTTISASAIADELNDRTSGGRYKIHVITIGPGEDLFARFGHIALMVDDNKHNIRKVYNFGTFDFDDPQLRFKYARGFLNYWLSIGSYQGMVKAYRHYDRELVVRTLALTSKQAMSVSEKLRINAMPQNRVYLYRHYWDNCCTRIRDIINDATDGSIANGRRDKPTGRTFRYWTDKVLSGLPIYQTIILYSLGPAIDQPITRWDEQFLPFILAQDLDKTLVGPDKHPLVEKKVVVVERQGPKIGVEIPNMDIEIIAALALIALVSLLVPMFFKEKKISARAIGFGLFFWGLIAGLGGLMLLLYWSATSHYDTHYNENLLVNPFFHLWLIGPALKLIFKARLNKKTTRFLGYYLLASNGLILIDMLLKIGPFYQGNWGVIATALFCNTAGFLMLKRSKIIPKLSFGKLSV